MDLSAESPSPNLIGDEVDDPLLMAVTLETTDHIEVPQSYQEAISGPYAEYWQKAMLEEVEAHIQTKWPPCVDWQMDICCKGTVSKHCAI